MKKRIFSLFMVVIFILLFSPSVLAVKMYAPDGRTAEVNSTDVQAWKKVGWYDYPVTTVYAGDGREAVIAKSAVEAWVNVGWKTSNKVTMYAPDGRKATVKLKDVNSWKKVGWYDYPVVTMYAFDGRVTVVSADSKAAWKKVGWFESKNALYRYVADYVVENAHGGSEEAKYFRSHYHCLDMGNYYLFIIFPTYNASGEASWYKVYKSNSQIELLFYLGAQEEPFAEYIYSNYDLIEYWY